MQNPAIERAVRARAADWRRKLTSLDRRNPTLYFRPLKAGTLQLPSLDSEAVQNLADEGKPLDLATAVGATADLLKRVLTIRSKAKENEEERGIQTMFVALGMAGWKATDGGRDPKAPMFLLPVTVTDTPRGPQVVRSGDLVVNRVMLQAWAQDHRLEAPAYEDDEPIEPPIEAAFDALARAGAQLDGFAALRECHLSNFSFAKMAMVEDLKRHEDLLGENRLVLAIAGDPEAQRSIREDAGRVERDQLDAIDPSDELIVLEADEYQRQAIHSLTRFDADGVVDGPPGTGKSQTIANLIATLVGQGKKVLFVAEKRAALDAVRNRLAAAGLADLVLDLHGADTKRRAVYDRLRERDDKARSVAPVAPNTSANRLKQLRAQLNAYYRAINTPVAACGLSPRDLIARLARIDASPRPETLWYGEACRTLTAESEEQAARDVEYLARDPDLFRREAQTPWARADFTDQEDAARALRFAGETRQALENLLNHLRPVAQSCGSELSTFDDVLHASRTAETMRSVAAVYRPDILDADVDALARDLRPAGGNSVVRLGASMFSPKYRAALRAARSMTASHTKPDRLLASLEELRGVPDARRARALFSICTESYAATVRALESAFAAGRTAFTAAAGTPLVDRVDLALLTLRAYEAANRTARRVPDVRRAEHDLVANGYGSFVAELARTAAPAASWPAMLEYAWLRSHLEETKTAQPILGSFSRVEHERAVDEFREIDAKQIELAEATVRRSAAQAYITARNAHPDQATTFRAEVNEKTRHMPVRRLVQRAGDVITGLCPCWMASPLSVSQLIAGRVLFDVVIFDEASQVLPEDAIPSIMRGKRTIVAGDQKQLPPTAFFAAASADGDDEDAEDDDPELVNVSIEGMESILDVMLTFCNRQNLNVHYRSLDESLIRFSNHEFYRDRLVTFPGPGIGDGGIRHVLVDSPFVDGEELSSSAEIARVTDLVLEHAEMRPDETLGVIAMGIKHARRLEASIDQHRKLCGDLDDFFAKDDVNRAFFVKNLERVQGDERDAIILSLGYAKDASGRLKNKLSALNHSGGERRLNVAVTRSKTRMTVASTFTEDDMEASRFSAAGAQKLCRFVEYARSGGKKLSDVEQMDVEMNDFERDVFDALTAKGLRLVPQLGVSQYRLDFAVLHPTLPNRYVLAIECDGAPYHSSATARDRDRLRQRHLEAMGWRFHRIWSLDWYEERAAEIARALAAHAAAVVEAERPTATVAAQCASYQRPSAAAVSANGNLPRGPKPRVTPRDRIADYPESQIRSVLDWIASDGRLRDDDEMLADAVPALGFARRGKLIEDRLRRSITAWRNGRR